MSHTLVFHLAFPFPCPHLSISQISRLYRNSRDFLLHPGFLFDTDFHISVFLSLVFPPPVFPPCVFCFSCPHLSDFPNISPLSQTLWMSILPSGQQMTSEAHGSVDEAPVHQILIPLQSAPSDTYSTGSTMSKHHQATLPSKVRISEPSQPSHGTHPSLFSSDGFEDELGSGGDEPSRAPSPMATEQHFVVHYPNYATLFG
ncbi:hypothetical protein BS47DRAFT_1400202 [Hydnum rufescens UP504]|uniref:Uncharacterized protein n=1 Tax=Hydnum rufescens UP504 TaxID=1448309 RepID=A0A9P6AI07_9AGAM|nr:hypothetical protein BS47DRAFT_1400202 [Hydnum rufescens UP504]